MGESEIVRIFAQSLLMENITEGRFFRYNVRTVPLQSTNNRLSDVIRMHSHISKGSNYKRVLSDEIVHLIVVADDLGAISVFAFNRFRMSAFREFHQRSDALLNFKLKIISYAFAKFVNEILAYTLKLSICTFRNDYYMQHNQLCAFSVC